MLIIYQAIDGSVVSLSGLRNVADVPRGAVDATREAVDAIRLVDPLPEGQAEYRIYDAALMNAVWEAFDRGAVLTVVLDDSGQPVGLKADGALILPGVAPG